MLLLPEVIQPPESLFSRKGRKQTSLYITTFVVMLISSDKFDWQE